MEERGRVVKGSESSRAITFGSRRRLTKEDGKLSSLASLKSSKGLVIPEVRKVLLRRHSEDTEKTLHRKSVIYPSEMAKSDWCPRATFYRMRGLPVPESSSSFTIENVFAEGNRIHNKWQKWLADTGKLWGDWRCSRCSEYVRDSLKPEGNEFGECVGTSWVDLEKKDSSFSHDWQYKEVTLQSTTLPISGHADGALVDHNCLIELKSLGVGSLRFEAPALLASHTHEVKSKKVVDIDGIWKDFHRPLLSHIKQGNIYLWMAEQNGLPFDKISFVYEFKANQQAKEFVVSKSDSILEPMLETSEIIAQAVKEGKPPDCPFGGCASCRAYESMMKT